MYLEGMAVDVAGCLGERIFREILCSDVTFDYRASDVLHRSFQLCYTHFSAHNPLNPFSHLPTLRIDGQHRQSVAHTHSHCIA